LPAADRVLDKRICPRQPRQLPHPGGSKDLATVQFAQTVLKIGAVRILVVVALCRVRSLCKMACPSIVEINKI
jgi:hypothetical protein